MITYEQLDYIKSLVLNSNDVEIEQAYKKWYEHDYSKAGLIEILLFQLIKQEKEEFGYRYNRNHDLLIPLLLKFKEEK